MTDNDVKEVYGISTRKANDLYKQYNIRSVKTLRAYVRKIPNLLNNSQINSLRYHSHVATNITHAEANEFVSFLLKYVKLEPVGAYAKKERFVKALHFLTTSALDKHIAILEQKNIITATLSYTLDKYVGIIYFPKRDLYRILEINKVNADEKPFAMLFYNSSPSFINNIKRTAKRNNYILTNTGLFSKKNKHITGIRTEQDIFKTLGIKYVPPQDRI